jgi:uncharacterized protein YqhQ
VRFVTKPNLALQRLTTREPDADMLEVAIVAFQRVLAFEEEAVVVTEETEISRPEPAVPV